MLAFRHSQPQRRVTRIFRRVDSLAVGELGRGGTAAVLQTLVHLPEPIAARRMCPTLHVGFERRGENAGSERQPTATGIRAAISASIWCPGGEARPEGPGIVSSGAHHRLATQAPTIRSDTAES